MTTALEARARWHLEIGYPQPGQEPVPSAVDDFEDPDDLVCPDCGEGPYDCRCHEGDDCGRWRNGNLSRSCSKAGSEECDFECPYRGSLRL